MFGPDGFDLGRDGSAPIVTDLAGCDDELGFDDAFQIWRETRSDARHGDSPCKVTRLVEYGGGQALHIVFKTAVGAPKARVADRLDHGVQVF